MTQKVIQTAEHQLSVARARIKRLEAENGELRLMLSRLTLQAKKQPTLNKPALPLRNPNQGNKHDLNRSSALSEDKSPSYARSTRASRLRYSLLPSSDTDSTPTTTHSKLVVVDGKTYVYRNGELTMRSFGYLMSTESALWRFGSNEGLREQRCGVSYLRLARPKCRYKPRYSERSDAVSEECSQPPTPIQIISQAEFDDMIERKGIELRTRLYSNHLVREPAYNVAIDHDELFDILWRAERLAKRCLWRWLRTNQPAQCRWSGLHYLSDMDLGRDRVCRLVYGNRPFYDHRYTKTNEVKQVIEDLITLRNRVHHFYGRGYTMTVVDEHLFDVQRFAVLLYDEEVAESVRGLRDRLRQVAEEVVREIEAVGLLTALPFVGDYPWQHHHIELFERVLARRRARSDGDDRYIRAQYSSAVIEAAQQYGERQDSISWDCEPDVEESLANVRRLEKAAYEKATGAILEDQQGSVTLQSLPNRPRRASTSARGSLESHGKQSHAQESKRRASFSVGVRQQIYHCSR